MPHQLSEKEKENKKKDLEKANRDREARDHLSRRRAAPPLVLTRVRLIIKEIRLVIFVASKCLSRLERVRGCRGVKPPYKEQLNTLGLLLSTSCAPTFDFRRKPMVGAWHTKRKRGSSGKLAGFRRENGRKMPMM